MPQFRNFFLLLYLSSYIGKSSGIISKTEATVAASFLAELQYRRFTIVTPPSNIPSKQILDAARIFGAHGVAVNFRPSSGFYDEITHIKNTFPTHRISIMTRSSMFHSSFDDREGPVRLRSLEDRYRWLIRNHYSWIVLMDSETDYVPGDIVIPHYIEVFLLQPTINGFDIWEQYTFNNSAKRELFASWTYSYGLLIRRHAALFKRRDLSGTVVKRVVFKLVEAPGGGDLLRVSNEIWDNIGAMFGLTYLKMERMQRVDDLFVDYEVSPQLLLYHFVTPFREKSFGPVLKMNMYMYFKHLNTNPLTNYIIRPFDTGLWFTLFGWIFVTSVISVTIRACSKGGFTTFVHRSFSVFDAFCCQDSDEEIHSASERMASLSTWTTVLIVVSAYSSIIFSFMTVRESYIPFKNVEGMIENGKYKFGGQNNTLAMNLQYLVGPKSSIFEASKKFLIDVKTMPTSLNEGINRICHDKHFAYVGYGHILLKIPSPCRLQKMPTPFFSGSLTLATQHGFSLGPAFKEKMPTLFSNGVISKLQKIYDLEVYENDVEDFLPVDAELMKPVLLLMPAGVFLSLVLLVFEILSINKNAIIKYLLNIVIGTHS